MNKKLSSLLILLSIFSNNLQAEKKHKYTDSIKVIATAYSSAHKETDRSPYLAAWNNILNPKVKSIAVSRDLIKIGLTNGMKVHIEGLEGEFLVLDKMNKKWRQKIDIYMGNNQSKAIKWGKREVIIYWTASLYKNKK